ncbi:putative membrane-bound dehydrogenase domain-containing protein [Dyadobacter soli]|uniref:Putative membrane-bound dehydrogenase domain-containing protein n=1 Tax=Dyadobacter soli TaxID=659014 RepID=A0A1G7BXM7_9BACT|nr:PVC-type heme-binding CxxCH protein [Dyadobacter soli]SDE31848.1 putative membrane-bound dehydrogenase domain-containing protein [Dyadobacter soli]
MNFKKSLILFPAGCLLAGLMVASYQRSNPSTIDAASADTLYKDLSDAQKRSSRYAVAGLTTANGLEATLFTSEPTITNPTNIDVDHLGRVWVCEAYNYRPAINGNPTKNEGDRIVVLEDTNGDGKSDKSTVFYQGAEINAPLGVWVMGNKVIVSQSPYVWLFTDENGDLKADKKEVIFEGIGGDQHDHGMHAFVFGPDGKLYFNFGNEGDHLLDGKGNPVVGKDGKPIDFSKLKQGMVFRCDPDFTNIEPLGNNFRNNFEVAVDSYGTMWQSDNDDDGNKGVRINYVMQYGNYGYTDEMTGAGWRANRTNMEDSIPYRHWHLNDPGVVPNLLQTGSGSPTGMVVYEGKLLPKEFWGQMIHCEPGHNVVRSYPVEKSGAGYTAKIVNVVDGKRDQWFRPSDVCVAPDGSLLVSDWYDPGVGGHQAGDQGKGRIYRIAPLNTPYRVPKSDFTTAAGAVEALQSPNLSIRYHAWTALNEMGVKAAPALEKLFANKNAEPRMRARALWLLSKWPFTTKKTIDLAIKDANADIRIAGLRAASESKHVDVIPYIKTLVKDAEPQVRRECALLLHHNPSPDAPALWASIAKQYDGKDRWYLEALGIGADAQWDPFFKAWLGKAGANPVGTQAGKDIVWRSRGKESVQLLASLAGDPTVDLKSRLRYFRAFDFNSAGREKSMALLKLTNGSGKDQDKVNELVMRHLDPAFVKQTPEAMAALKKMLDLTYGTQAYLELIAKYELPSENERLLTMTQEQSNSRSGSAAASQLIKQGGTPMLWKVVKGTDEAKSVAVLTALKSVGSKDALDILRTVATESGFSENQQITAAKSLGGTMSGEDQVLVLLKEGKLSGEAKTAAVKGLAGAWRKSVKLEAAKYLDGATVATKKHPEVKDLVGMKGDLAKGKQVFTSYCSVCHQVNGEGMDFGPKLSEIGSKLPKEAQYAAIFDPSAGIGFGYEGFEVTLKDGTTVSGIVSSKTETDLILKFPGGSTQEYKMSQVKSIKQLKDSMMPSGLQDAMSTEELVSLVDYLSNLKKQ